MPSILNIAAYKFVTLDELPAKRAHLKSLCRDLDLKGTILLSVEGINLFVAGVESSVRTFLASLHGLPEFHGLAVKESWSNRQPFNRMLVRLKKEIIAFGIPEIQPAIRSSKRLAPQELKKWLDEGRKVTLLDTRNHYEFEVGTFKNALQADINDFRHFPDAVNKLPDALKSETVVTFCTGGIRCEKGAPYLEKMGFRDVYQLDGGILKYFEECGGDHYQGECFVFDQRVALDPALKETETAQCFACRSPLSPRELESDLYVPGKSCPHCFKPPEVVLRKQLEIRHQKLRSVIYPLPGSQPYVNERPIHVSEKYEGWKLIDMLVDIRTIQGEEEWKSICKQGRIRFKGEALRADSIVRAGYRIIHITPETSEPEVNPEIRFIYEDDAIVVLDKPAPLPVHSGGRFHKNTLQHFLNQVFHPHLLRPAHRLDANTSGVMVLAKTRSVAARLQPQFETGQVRKCYLAHVQGPPEFSNFESTAPISDQPGPIGVRLIDPQGLPARTRFKLLHAYSDGTSLLEVHPITGRTNQIRVHLWDLNLPLVGDPAYLKNRQLGRIQTLNVEDPPMHLQSASIEFNHPTLGKPMKFEVPKPVWADPIKTV